MDQVCFDTRQFRITPQQFEILNEGVEKIRLSMILMRCVLPIPVAIENTSDRPSTISDHIPSASGLMLTLQQRRNNM